MAVYFLDSSAVVKRYAEETGSAWVAAVTDPQVGHRLYLARITAVEVVAAMMRRQRGGAMTAADATTALTDFSDDLAQQYLQIDITTSLLTQAMQLAATYALRGYDAVQLAAALTVHHARAALRFPPLTLVSADQELNTAARTAGVLVDDPNTH
jgi:hypothetical protein